MKSKYISEHITYSESIKSSTAIRKGIENIPTEYQMQNMSQVADKVFEPLREWVGGPIKVTSFFRCEELNKAIGGEVPGRNIVKEEQLMLMIYIIINQMLKCFIL